MELTGKTVLVYGSARSGIGAAHLLLSAGAVPVIFDENKEANAEEIRGRVGAAVDVVLGELPEDPAGRFALAVLSPGVPAAAPKVAQLRDAGIPVWSEIELAWQLGKGRVLAVTGTNGKTTTTALLGHILAAVFPEVYVAGNIGRSYADIAPRQTADAVTALEVSSFQLETIADFHPSAAVITNITPDHLDRHGSMEEYIRVKERIAENMTAEDLLVLNHADPVLRAFGESGIAPQVRWFSSAGPVDGGSFLEEGVIRRADASGVRDLVRIGELQLLGTHNYENVMAAVELAAFAGVPEEKIREAVCSFAGVEHRIEFVEEKRGVRWYNDSKGTNPDAAIRGIRAMDRPTLLIGGGYDKGADYTEWIRAFDGKVKYFALIGQTREKIAAQARETGFPASDIHFFDDLEQAVAACAEAAKEGDAVLLSPACASWGQFKDFEERGERFKEYVRAL